MPKRKMTDAARRENVLMVTVKHRMADAGLEYAKDVAVRIAMNPETYRYHKNNHFRHMYLENFGDLVRCLGMTGRDLCAIFGVPYEGKN